VFAIRLNVFLLLKHPESSLATQAEFAKAFVTNALAEVRDKIRPTWNQ
jgi:hypothetical protein